MKKIFICAIAAACTAGMVSAQTKSPVKKTAAPVAAKSRPRKARIHSSFETGAHEILERRHAHGSGDLRVAPLKSARRPRGRGCQLSA